MDRGTARQLIQHAVRTTEPRWRQYVAHWGDVDTVFIHRGYEQQGFESHKLRPLLAEQGCLSIDVLGGILRAEDGTKYRRDYSGSLDSPFCSLLRGGQRGEDGQALHEALSQFLEGDARKGAAFWRLIWLMLRACQFLRQNYASSFRHYLLESYRSYRGVAISEREFLRLDPESWSTFCAKAKPWTPLPGIGENVFNYLLGDVVEARFAGGSYKLDDANQHFLRVTGIVDLIGKLERESVIPFLRGLGLEWTLRQVNKGLYTYCSITEEKNYGFCRSSEDCERCGNAALCEQRLGRPPKSFPAAPDCRVRPG